MARQAVVVSTVVFTLMAVTTIGPLLHGGYNRTEDVTVIVGGTASQRMYITSNLDASEPISPRKEGECQPKKHIVFLKTHKTAGTTTARIFDLFALKNNLTAAVPPEGQPYMDRVRLFQRDMIAKLRKNGVKFRDTVGFNVFTSHARYNRKEMDAVVHNAKYITILRDPSKQMASALAFYKFGKHLEHEFRRKGRTYTNVLEEFMRDPVANMELIKSKPMSHAMHNQQFFDLGLDTKYYTDWVKINTTMRKLDEELDLVMITEYYDESLILLRDLLCWSTEDIFYTKTNVRKTSSKQSHPDTLTKIRQWNGADTHLYDYFNKTLWQKIAAYGPTFDDELRKFRDRLKNKIGGKKGSHGKLIMRIKKRMKTIYA